MIPSCGCSFDIYIKIIDCLMTFVKMLWKLTVVWRVFDAAVMFGEALLKVAPVYVQYIRPWAWNIVQRRLFPFPCF